MDLAAIEERLYNAAASVVVDPRVLRRIIKAHRGAGGLVPHARCYVLTRGELGALGLAGELGRPIDTLPDPVILLSRPAPRELGGEGGVAALNRLWRAAFHSRVHIALEQQLRDGTLDQATLRAKIDAIGQIEFDEIRATLRHDDLVLPPYDDREIFVEFAALFLELHRFAPELIVTTFPGLGEPERIVRLLAEHVDSAELFEAGRPAEVVLPTPRVSRSSAASFSTHLALKELADRRIEPLSAARAQALLARVAAARVKGNDARAILDAARACAASDLETTQRAQAEARAGLASLDARVNAAFREPRESGKPASDLSLAPLLRLVADAAVVAGGYAPEARLLFALQRAAIAHEKLQHTVDVAGFLVSRGKRNVVRPLTALRELGVLQALHGATSLAHRARVSVADKRLLVAVVSQAASRARENLRAALRPKLERVLVEVGLRAESDPERLAQNTVVEELLDELGDNGFLSFGSLRDALSRNQLKLEDLSGARELVLGDPIVRADAALDHELDGAYRKSDVYVRWLQKLSSVPFGTGLGRFITLYLLLPLGGAFVALEAALHLVVPIAKKLGLGSFDPMTPATFAATTAVVFGVVHSQAFRSTVLQLLGVLAMVLSFVFVRLPRAVFARPSVRRWFASPNVRLVLRRGIAPGILGVLEWRYAPFASRDSALGVAVAFAAFLLASAILSTPLGAWLEDTFFEEIGPMWQHVTRNVLYGAVRMVQRFFEVLLDTFDRAVFRVEEFLHFRDGEASTLGVLWRGAAGLVFAVVAYVARMYVTLMLEPEINPLKHFPVVTVAHKLMLPVTPALLSAFTAAMSPLGSIVGGTIAAVTVFLVPSVFGFFAWELKENYRLYRATRSRQLLPSTIGAHGETMRGLLVPGFHSGTLPKAYARLRRAAERESDAAFVRRVALAGNTAEAALRSLGDFREALRDVEERVRRFVERELVELLATAARWQYGRLAVEKVELSSNRIRVGVVCAELSAIPCVLTFEEQSGLVVAGLAKAGFVSELVRRGGEAACLFENALAGLYHRAEVDVVREQLEAHLDPGVHYDLADDGLVVWPTRDYRTELRYRLRERLGAPRAEAVEPVVLGRPLEVPAPVVDTRQIHFAGQRIGWVAWVAAWGAAAHPNATIPRLSSGASLLPADVVASATGAAA